MTKEWRIFVGYLPIAAAISTIGSHNHMDTKAIHPEYGVIKKQIAAIRRRVWHPCHTHSAKDYHAHLVGMARMPYPPTLY